MPKLKTHRGAAKRFKITARGKVRRRRAYLRHLLSTKNRGRKRRLGKATLVSPADARSIKKLIPYL